LTRRPQTEVESCHRFAADYVTSGYDVKVQLRISTFCTAAIFAESKEESRLLRTENEANTFRIEIWFQLFSTLSVESFRNKRYKEHIWQLI